MRWPTFIANLLIASFCFDRLFPERAIMANQGDWFFWGLMTLAVVIMASEAILGILNYQERP